MKEELNKLVVGSPSPPYVEHIWERQNLRGSSGG